MKEWERRAIAGELELRSREGERALIAGYGVVFGKPSENLGGFVEVVKPQAVARTISQRDIRCLVNHDPNWPLGRTGNGSMRLRADSRGLEYEGDGGLRDPDGRRAAAVGAEAVALRSIHAWVDPETDADAKASYKFPHHASPGGPANTRACSAGMAVLNGGRGGADIPDADRAGVWRHLARHVREADMEPPA